MRKDSTPFIPFRPTFRISRLEDDRRISSLQVPIDMAGYLFDAKHQRRIHMEYELYTKTYIVYTQDRTQTPSLTLIPWTRTES